MRFRLKLGSSSLLSNLAFRSLRLHIAAGRRSAHARGRGSILGTAGLLGADGTHLGVAKRRNIGDPDTGAGVHPRFPLMRLVATSDKLPLDGVGLLVD